MATTDEETRPLLAEKGGRPAEKGFFERFVQPCAAELFGTAVFVFVGTMAACMQPADLLAVAFTHGLAIAVLITGLGHISGGHFNPAVSLGVLAAGRLSPLLALGYLMSQLVGAILGAALCLGVLSYPYVNVSGEAVPLAGSSVNLTAYEALGGGVHVVAAGVSVDQALLCETVVTTLLVLTVLMTAINGASSQPYAGFAIGLAVIVGIVAAGKISGASMNPARSFGPAVVMGSVEAWDRHYIYWVGPAIGAVLAAAFYRFLFADNDGRLVFKNSKQE